MLEESSRAVLQLLNFTLDPGCYEVIVDGRKVNLTSTEFGILSLLATKPGWVFSRQQIGKALHGEDYIVTSRVVDVQIFCLRKKLGSAARYIETVRGVGYKLKD